MRLYSAPLLGSPAGMGTLSSSFPTFQEPSPSPCQWGGEAQAGPVGVISPGWCGQGNSPNLCPLLKKGLFYKRRDLHRLVTPWPRK